MSANLKNTTEKKKFKITFNDIIEAETEEQAYDELLKYLSNMVRYEDVTAFEFEPVK